jgi:hypothetical protein
VNYSGFDDDKKIVINTKRVIARPLGRADGGDLYRLEPSLGVG